MVGHVEWVEFARVLHVPRAGEIVHTEEVWEDVAGGGAVVAVQLARLAGAATFYTTLGDDELGRRARARLGELGVRVEATHRDRQRRAFVHLDAAGERTITVIGDRLVPAGDEPLPWEELRGADGVFFTGGDPAALHAARAARVLVATPRTGDVLVEAPVALDALVHSGRDPGEQPRVLDPPPALVVATDGAEGGRWTAAEGRTGAWGASPPPGPVADAYGCGDSFAAGFTYGLAANLGLEDALQLAARCGATCLTGRGPYGRQLTLGPAGAEAR